MKKEIKNAIEEVRSRRIRNWIRYNGKDYLSEPEVTVFADAERTLADEVERLNTKVSELQQLADTYTGP